MNFDLPFFGKGKKEKRVVPPQIPSILLETIHPQPRRKKQESNVIVDPALAKEAAALDRVANIPNMLPDEMDHMRGQIVVHQRSLDSAKGGMFARHGANHEQIVRESIVNDEAMIAKYERGLSGLALLDQRMNQDREPAALSEKLAGEIANIQKNLEHFQDARDETTSRKLATELGQYVTAKEELDRMIREAKG